MKKLILVSNRFVDEFNNSWSSIFEDIDSATKKSESLMNCRDCRDCRDCSYCGSCSDCSDCGSCSDCSNCHDCSDCLDCRNCRYCRDCSSCSGFLVNPMMYRTPKIGSRNSNTVVYWTNKEDSQVICGCFRGNIEQFKEKVLNVHSQTEHLQPYLKQIEIMEYLINNND